MSCPYRNHCISSVICKSNIFLLSNPQNAAAGATETLQIGYKVLVSGLWLGQGVGSVILATFLLYWNFSQVLVIEEMNYKPSTRTFPPCCIWEDITCWCLDEADQTVSCQSCHVKEIIHCGLQVNSGHARLVQQYSPQLGSSHEEKVFQKQTNFHIASTNSKNYADRQTDKWYNWQLLKNTFIPCNALGYAVGESKHTSGCPNKFVKFCNRK